MAQTTRRKSRSVDDDSEAASVKPVVLRMGLMLLWKALLNMKERANAPAFVNALLMSLSVRVAAELRFKISVVLGCLKVPGDGEGVVGSETLGVDLDGVKPRFCAFSTRKFVVVEISWEAFLLVACKAVLDAS